MHGGQGVGGGKFDFLGGGRVRQRTPHPAAAGEQGKSYQGQWHQQCRTYQLHIAPHVLILVAGYMDFDHDPAGTCCRGRTAAAVLAYAVSALLERLRSCSLRNFLRRRMCWGVTSTSSSSSMNSRACSSEKRIGGVRMMFSSEPAARMLVSCFARSGFNRKSTRLN